MISVAVGPSTQVEREITKTPVGSLYLSLPAGYPRHNTRPYTRKQLPQQKETSLYAYITIQGLIGRGRNKLLGSLMKSSGRRWIE